MKSVMIHFFRLLVLAAPTLAYSYWDCDSKVKWSADAALLILRPALENLSYGNEITYEDLGVELVAGGAVTPYNTYSGFASERPQRFDFHYRPGFRAKITAETINYGLSSSIIWTNYHSSSERKGEGLMISPSTGIFFKAPPTIFSYGTAIGNPSDTAPLSTLGLAQYSLCFDQGDLLFSKKLNLYRALTLEPRIGFSFVKIKQKVKGSYFLSPTHTPSIFNISNELVQNDAIRFEGLGTKAGFHSEWRISKILNLFGGMTGALYYGEFDVKQFAFEQATDGAFPAANILLNEHNRFQDVRFAGMVNLGVEYLFHFNCDRNSVRLAASWEGHWFPSQNMFGILNTLGSINSVPTNVHSAGIDNSNKPSVVGGDLSLSGWAISISLCF